MSLNEGHCIGGILCEIHCYLVVSMVSDSYERVLTVDCSRNDSIVPVVVSAWDVHIFTTTKTRFDYASSLGHCVLIKPNTVWDDLPCISPISPVVWCSPLNIVYHAFEQPDLPPFLCSSS